MESLERAAEPWDRSATAAIALLVLAACASLLWLVHPWYEATMETNDASMYILSAKSLLAGEGYSYLGMPFTMRPPGFSILIAPVVAWCGVHFQALNLYVSLFGVAGVALFFVFARERLGNLLALCLSCAVWLSPPWRQMCNQVMSDVPGTALLFACLLLERWADRAPSARRDAVLGVCIALAAYVRSINVLLVPAIILSRAFRDSALRGDRSSWLRFLRKRAVVLAGVPVLALLPWSVRNTLRHPEPPLDQNVQYSYSTSMWHVDGGDPSSPRRELSEILARVPVRTREVLSAMGNRLRSSEAGTAHLCLGAAMAAASAFVLIRRRSAPEFFAFGTLGVLLIYFIFDDRLALPIYLVALCASVEALTWWMERFTGKRAARIGVAFVILWFTVLGFAPRQRWEEIEATHRKSIELCAGWNARLPPDARLAAPIGWHWSVYLERPVYSLFPAVYRTKSTNSAEQVIDKYGIDTVIMGIDPPDDPGLLAYFLQRYGTQERVGRGVIIRVRTRKARRVRGDPSRARTPGACRRGLIQVRTNGYHPPARPWNRACRRSPSWSRCTGARSSCVLSSSGFDPY